MKPFVDSKELPGTTCKRDSGGFSSVPLSQISLRRRDLPYSPLTVAFLLQFKSNRNPAAMVTTNRALFFFTK